MMNKERKKTGIIGYRSKAAAIHMIEFLSLNFVLVFYFFSSLFSFFYIFIKRNQFLCTNFVFMVYISCIWAAAGRTESKANNVKCMRITFRCEITYTLVPFITQLDLFNIQLAKTCLDCHIKCPMSLICAQRTHIFVHEITKHHFTHLNFDATTCSYRKTQKRTHQLTFSGPPQSQILHKYIESISVYPVRIIYTGFLNLIDI